MLSPLKPLLCRHEYFWSERHHADRCRRCGKQRTDEGQGEAAAPAPEPVALAPAQPVDFLIRPAQAAQTSAHDDLALEALPAYRPIDDSFLAIPEPPPVGQMVVPVRPPAPSKKVLAAQARLRRETLLKMLDRLSTGATPSREEAIDAVLAVIEDAHSSDPVLFGPDAADHFARLHDARAGSVFRFEAA